MQNKVELLTNGIIYVERSGNPAEPLLTELFRQAATLVVQLRKQGKPVLILANNTRDTLVSPRVTAFLLQLDFDKAAAYGTPKRLNNLRDLMLRANGLEEKVASFQSRDEALQWLHAANYSTA